MRFILLFPLFAAILLSACTDGPEASPPANDKRKAKPVLVEVVPAEVQLKAITWRRSGTLVYRRLFHAYSREEGRIVHLPWFEGDQVKQGAILLTLDDELLKAELRKARATRSMALRKVSRLERLRKTKAASEEDLVEAQTELELAQAEVEILKLRVGYTNIEAPFDGVVTQRLAEPGDVKPRNSHLLTLADPASLVARVAVSEKILADIEPSSRISLYLDIPGSNSLDGRLQRIFPTLDPNTRQGILEISLAETPATIHAGQFTRVEIRGKERKRLLIPASALRTDRHGEYVYLIRDKQAKRQYVVSGAHFGDQLEILQGLKRGDLVVERGFMNLKDGTPVKMLNQRTAP